MRGTSLIGRNAVAAPTVTSLSVTSGSAVGGTATTITGTNLTGATVVEFGRSGIFASAGSVIVVNSTTITCTSPLIASNTFLYNLSSRLVDVRVTTPGGTGTLTNGFTYNNPVATVSVSPTSATHNGGTALTFTSTGFATAGVILSSVSAGFSAQFTCASPTVVNDTTVTATTAVTNLGTGVGFAQLNFNVCQRTVSITFT